MNSYEIRIAGLIDRRRALALGADECRWVDGAVTELAFGALDSAALYGVIARLRDAGLELVAVARVVEPGTGRASSECSAPAEGREGRSQ